MHTDAHISGDQPLTIEQRGDVAVVTLNRPAKRNSLNEATVQALEAFFSEIPDGVRAVVLCGAGEHFSAGLDLTEIKQSGSIADGIRHSRLWHRAFGCIEFGAVPVVAVLHGAVVGGGLELACATHVRVAERSTFYALPEGQRGIFVGGGGAVRITRLIGVSRMQDMMLTGRVYDATEGQAVALSHYLVEPGQGLAKGIELARKIAANTGLTNFAITNALPRIADMGQDQGLLAESLMAAIAGDNPEAKERVRKFLEKQAPKAARAGD
jgi:enoyl-CoA hydratase/carnithine racemase